MFLFICNSTKGISMDFNVLAAQNAYQPYNYNIQSPEISGGRVGAGQTGGTQQPQSTNPFAGEIGEVAQIGAEKRDGYWNGLGGTNDPGDHKIFFAA